MFNLQCIFWVNPLLPFGRYSAHFINIWFFWSRGWGWGCESELPWSRLRSSYGSHQMALTELWIHRFCSNDPKIKNKIPLYPQVALILWIRWPPERKFNMTTIRNYFNLDFKCGVCVKILSLLCVLKTDVVLYPLLKEYPYIPLVKINATPYFLDYYSLALLFGLIFAP